MKSIAAARILGLANGFAALVAWTAKGPVHPPARLRLPALDADVVTLRPHAGLEDQRDSRRDQEDAAGAWDRRNRQPCDDQQHPEREHRPFDNRIVEELTPLFPPAHRPAFGHGVLFAQDGLRERSMP